MEIEQDLQVWRLFNVHVFNSLSPSNSSSSLSSTRSTRMSNIELMVREFMRSSMLLLHLSNWGGGGVGS